MSPRSAQVQGVIMEKNKVVGHVVTSAQLRRFMAILREGVTVKVTRVGEEFVVRKK